MTTSLTSHLHYPSSLGEESSPYRATPDTPTRHRSYTLQHKLHVIQWIEDEKSSLRAASKQFKVDRKVIRSWMKNKDTLRSAISLHGPEKRKLHQGRPPKSQKLDKQVLKHLLSLRSEGVGVCDQELVRKARECASELGIEDFKGAPSWLKRWKQRCGVESHNGTNDAVNHSIQEDNVVIENDVQESCRLSHVMSCDQVKLVASWSSSSIVADDNHQSCDVSDGPVHFDISTIEHNYTSLLLDTTTSIGNPPLNLCNDVAYKILQCGENTTTHEEHPFPMAPSSDNPAAVLAVFEVIPPSNSDDVMIFDPSDQCIMGNLDLPLSHEVVVRDDDTSYDVIINADQDDVIVNTDHNSITQSSSCTDTSFQPELSSPKTAPFDSQSSLLLTCTPTHSQNKQKSKSTTSTKRRTTRRSGKGRKNKRGCQVKTTTGNNSDISLDPVTALPDLMLDDPQGPSGLLASRILQPVFPDEPEIVYMDMQLGTLNATH